MTDEVEPAHRRTISIRFDEFTLNRIRTLAARRHKGYQTLLKEFVLERLYEEERRDAAMAVSEWRNDD